jgi:hypothetical protein
MSRQTIKPATYDGSGPWLDYRAHFEACAELSAWNYNQKGLYLAVSLGGNAQGVLGNMPKGAKSDYHSLIKTLEDRFAPPSQTELYRVQMRSDVRKLESLFPNWGKPFDDLQIWHTPLRQLRSGRRYPKINLWTHSSTRKCAFALSRHVPRT